MKRDASKRRSADVGTCHGTCHVWTGKDLLKEEVRGLDGGCAAIFSARSPEREGPNQDGAAVASLGRASALLAVADGLGGQPGGASASELALSRLRDVASATVEGTSARGAILDAIEAANRAVLDRGIGAATTLAVAEISDGHLRPYHVGDSAILVVGQRGKLKLQTLSHSPVGYAVESGLLDADEALHHEERHIVSNMVGAPDMRIEVGSALALAPRDTVLLATDGLMDNLGLAEIVEIVRRGPLERAARRLAELCDERMRRPLEGQPSKPDDVTFVLFRRAAG